MLLLQAKALSSGAPKPDAAPQVASAAPDVAAADAPRPHKKPTASKAGSNALSHLMQRQRQHCQVHNFYLEGCPDSSWQWHWWSSNSDAVSASQTDSSQKQGHSAVGRPANVCKAWTATFQLSGALAVLQAGCMLQSSLQPLGFRDLYSGTFCAGKTEHSSRLSTSVILAALCLACAGGSWPRRLLLARLCNDSSILTPEVSHLRLMMHNTTCDEAFCCPDCFVPYRCCISRSWKRVGTCTNVQGCRPEWKCIPCQLCESMNTLHVQAQRWGWMAPQAARK